MNSKLAQIIGMAFGLFQGKTDPVNFSLRQKIADNNMGHKSTPAHKMGLGGSGYTKASHEESKARRKMAAKSRKINRRK